MMPGQPSLERIFVGYPGGLRVPNTAKNCKHGRAPTEMSDTEDSSSKVEAANLTGLVT